MSTEIKRRQFVKKLSTGILGTGIALSAKANPVYTSRLTDPKRKKINFNPDPNVALIKGTDRKTNMYDALKLIEDDIKNSIGNKQVIIKPNFTRVKKEDWLASTHVDNIEAMLEFLKPFYKKRVIIAEGPGLAELIDVAMKMHFAGTPVSFMANVHCAAATQNFLALELPNQCADNPWWPQLVRTIGKKPLYTKGYVNVPVDAPGLGVELNEEEIKKTSS